MIFDQFSDATFQLVLAGSLLIGATGGILGAFAVLRKRSLMGDALAHAALPGVAGAFLLTGSKALPVLLTGATVSGVLGVLLIQFIGRHTRIKSDSALGIVLSVFFGVGIVLLTHIQQSSAGNQTGLDKFLFGQAASIVREDLIVMAGLALFVLGVLLLFFKEFKALIFDPDFLSASGFSARAVDLLLMGLIVLAVMVGLQAVGVILVAAMLITPAVAARFWSDRLGTVVFLSGLMGAAAGVVGTWISASAPRIPTGPVMVLVATGVFVVSALVAPGRGVIARWMQLRRNRVRESRQNFLRGFYELTEQKSGGDCHTTATLAAELGESEDSVERTARRMRRGGWLDRGDQGFWLTERGRRDAEFVVKSHRLWEHYLVHRSNLKSDHVDRSADDVEHILTPEIIAELERTLERERVNTSQPTNVHAITSEGEGRR